MGESVGVEGHHHDGAQFPNRKEVNGLNDVLESRGLAIAIIIPLLDFLEDLDLLVGRLLTFAVAERHFQGYLLGFRVQGGEHHAEASGGNQFGAPEAFLTQQCANGLVHGCYVDGRKFKGIHRLLNVWLIEQLLMHLLYLLLGLLMLFLKSQVLLLLLVQQFG